MHQRFRWILPVLGGCLLVASLVGMLAPLILPDALPARSGSALIPEDPSSTSPGALEGSEGAIVSMALTPLTEWSTVSETNEDDTCQQGHGTTEETVASLGWPPLALTASSRIRSDLQRCSDHGTWQHDTTLTTHEAITILQRPADLVEDPSRSKVTHVIPVQNTQPASQPDPPEIQCTWSATFLVTLDVCFPIKLLINANATMVRWVYQLLAPQAGFLWLTPTEEFTREDSGPNQTWQVSQAIVLAFLAAVIAWSGLRYLMGSAVDWLSYATLVEILPRILLGLAVALLSKQMMLGLIGANNVLSGLFSQTSIDHLLKETQEGVLANFLQIIYGVMAILFLVEGAVRMAILYLLYAFAPILFFCLALRETEQIARVSLTTMILFTFLQTMQIAMLDVGSQVFSGITGTESLFLLHLLVMIAILYITLLLFFMVMQWSLGSAANPLAYGTLGITSRMAKGMGRLASSPVTSLARDVLAPGLARTGSSLGTTAWSGMHGIAGRAAQAKPSTKASPSKSTVSPSRAAPAPRKATASSGSTTGTGATSSGVSPTGSAIPARASAHPRAAGPATPGSKAPTGATRTPRIPSPATRTSATPAGTPVVAPLTAASIARRRRAAASPSRSAASPSRAAPSPGRNTIAPRASRPGMRAPVKRSPGLPPIPPTP